MKVVLFCGGLGTRLRDYDENIPKPMVTVGARPIIWNLMRYYAHYGHKEFVLCLGHKSEVIKKYFLQYDECMSNDFELSEGARKVLLLNNDIAEWRITFADTGANSEIGERLRRVRPYLTDDDVFLANYADCLSDLPLPAFIGEFMSKTQVAAFVTVPPNTSFHYVSVENGLVTDVTDIAKTRLRVNGGFFIFRKKIFDYLEEGKDLVADAFPRLIKERQLAAYGYDGFWKAMDTFKDKVELDKLVAKGNPPWEIWRRKR